MFQALAMVMLEDKLLSQTIHISTLTPVVAVVVPQDLDFIAAQIQLQAMLVLLSTLMEVPVRVISMIYAFRDILLAKPILDALNYMDTTDIHFHTLLVYIPAISQMPMDSL